jgi:CheY-like chemotaxis protein
MAWRCGNAREIRGSDIAADSAVTFSPANLSAADPKAARLLPEELARRFNVFPLREDDRQLVVATADPSNLECEQSVAFASGRRVVFELAAPQAIAQAINAAYVSDRVAIKSPLPANANPVILIADDDPVQRLLVAATLEKSGFRVEQVNDGAAALERILAGEECALLVTDLQMPKMDGDTVIRKLRADSRTATLPVIVLTGSSEASRESELIELGADDYIRKPVEPPLLTARVRAALRRAGA